MRDKSFYQSINYKAYAEGSKKATAFIIVLAAVAFYAARWKAIFIAPVLYLLYLFMVWQSKKDPWLIEAYSVYNVQADHYDPWVHHELPAYGERPQGFGRGIRN